MVNSAMRPRRSCLYMPGANVKALEKAKSLAADVLIFDLEDSVAPEAKDEARANVTAALAAGGYGSREIIVRINALSTPWGQEDMRALAGSGAHGVLVPKVEAGAEIADIDDVLTESGWPEAAALWVMIETPNAILSVADIAIAARGTRLAAFVMGLNDLAKETRARAGMDRAPFWFALSAAVTAARAHALVAIDGVYNDIPNMQGFEDECRQGLGFGFDGKTLIHPNQIDVCNLVFAPSPDEIANARAVIAAFKAPENAGKGVIKVNGKMTELLHLDEAERIVGIAAAIDAAR